MGHPGLRAGLEREVAEIPVFRALGAQEFILGSMKLAIYGTLWLRKVCLTFCFSCFMAQPALCGDGNDPWQSLKQMRRGVGFVFVRRDMTCQYGQLKEVTDTSVAIKTDKANVVIDRSTLLRVRRGFRGVSVENSNPNMPLFTLYSGRSSWGDLLAFAPFQSKDHPGSAVHFSLKTTDGRLHQGTLSQVTAGENTLADKFGKPLTLSKGQIVQVDYITEKPLSDTEEFHWSELAALRIFDPPLYPRLFHIGDTMSVTLYQSTITEDNSTVACM
jgi:hypothetical protein